MTKAVNEWTNHTAYNLGKIYYTDQRAFYHLEMELIHQQLESSTMDAILTRVGQEKQYQELKAQMVENLQLMKKRDWIAMIQKGMEQDYEEERDIVETKINDNVCLDDRDEEDIDMIGQNIKPDDVEDVPKHIFKNETKLEFYELLKKYKVKKPVIEGIDLCFLESVYLFILIDSSLKIIDSSLKTQNL